MSLHGLLDFADDGGARRLNAEDLLHLHNVVARRVAALHALHAHDVSQAVPLHKQLEHFLAARVLLVHNCALHAGEALHRQARQRVLQGLQRKEHPTARVVRWQNVQLVRCLYFDVRIFQLELGVGQQGALHSDGVHVQQEGCDSAHAQLDGQEAAGRVVHLGYVLRYLAQRGQLNARFGLARFELAVGDVQACLDYGRANDFAGVDDFFDARDALRDVHARHASEMEGLQCHLRARFADRLSAQCAYSRAGLHLGSIVLLEAAVQEGVNVAVGEAVRCRDEGAKRRILSTAGREGLLQTRLH
mmetsp:Transcript_52664/g.132466  ORF Transcript_52664/g.132466 Transcript_52664/m.132466 type:complete len:303 (+) Transcript_52664:888-1796(+)